MIIHFNDPLYNQERIEGVYVIFNGEHTPIYCGQSKDIKNRLGQHRSWVGDNFYAKVIHVCEDKAERFKLEQKYHDENDGLLSKPTNGRHKHFNFEGISFKSANSLYRYLSEKYNVGLYPVSRAIKEGCSSFSQLEKVMIGYRASLSNSIIKSNKRRVGKKLNMKLRVCPHCGKEGKGGNMSRYHFDNCKGRYGI